MINEAVRTFSKIAGGVWSPLYTLPRNEKKVHELLILRGCPVYLPMRKHVNVQLVHSKGHSYPYKRELMVPMFSGYVFAHVTPDVREMLYRERSVLRILPVNDVQEDVLLREMQMIRRLEEVSENQKFDITAGLTEGTLVEFTDGPFKGWTGVVRDVDNTGKAYINITSVDSTIEIEYLAAWCRKL